MDKVPLTAKGYSKLQDELKHLKAVERPNVIKAIAEAREHGDLSENAEYHAAREKQGFIEGRIMDLEDKLARAEVIDVNELSGNVIKFGATVKMVDEDTDEEFKYQIVGDYEADLDKGMISVSSPIARGLISKKKGDSVEIKTPKGAKFYEILEVKYQ